MKEKSEVVVTPAEVTRTWIREDDVKIICEAWENFHGQVEVFESAVGALLVGRLIGHDALRILHSWRTLKNYEGILNITFKDTLEPRTPDSRRMNGIRYADRFKQFWKALAGGVASEKGARLAVNG